jgi:hypothetical protein
MKVTEPKLTLKEYDLWAQQHCPGKLPDPKHPDMKRRCGDAIYDFSTGRARLRLSVHVGAEQKKRDISGKYALLSRHFYYFGSKPIDILTEFDSLIVTRQGEQWRKNDPRKVRFVAWLESLGNQINVLEALPDNPPTLSGATSSCSSGCGPKKRPTGCMTSC